MPGLIPLTLIIVPIIEITLFVQIGGAIGLSWTLLIILATAILGARAIRRQGIEALVRAQAQMANGQPPMGEIVHGVLILIAGILLLTPGFMTDTLGFLLLFPAARVFVLELAASFILPKLFSGISARRRGAQKPTDAKTIDGDYRVEDPDD